MTPFEFDKAAGQQALNNDISDIIVRSNNGYQNRQFIWGLILFFIGIAGICLYTHILAVISFVLIMTVGANKIEETL